MLTFLTAKGLCDAQIQLVSGHETKESLEVYHICHWSRSKTPISTRFSRLGSDLGTSFL
jgi:hypothetical protein